MPPEQPPEDIPSLSEEWQAQRERASARERVYEVALQLYEPTRVKEIAERADVSKETARTYLQWFTELGVLDQPTSSPDTFERNEQYFEWKRIQRLQSNSEDELRQRAEELSQRERAFRDQFGVDDPDDVDALDHADYTDIEAVWQDVREWRTVRRRLRELERARRLRENGSEAPA